MQGKINKIDPLKLSRTEASFIRVYFKMEDKTWAETNIVPSYRNYKRWKPILDLGVGTVVGGLRYRRIPEIDADSPVVVIKKPDSRQETLL